MPEGIGDHPAQRGDINDRLAGHATVLVSWEDATSDAMTQEDDVVTAASQSLGHARARVAPDAACRTASAAAMPPISGPGGSWVR
jgi:hypothetical protein